MSVERTLRTFTVNEYLTLERDAKYRSEWVDGQIYAMSGGSLPHNIILVNIVGELYVRLRGTPCQPFTDNQQVGVAAGKLFTYPDVTVVCGEPQYHDTQKHVLTNPVVLFEVLSPSTEQYDRGQKFLKYQQIKSLTDYVLVAQDLPRVEHYARQPDGSWPAAVPLGLDAMLNLPGIGVALPVRDLYDRVRFEDHSNSTGDDDSGLDVLDEPAF